MDERIINNANFIDAVNHLRGIGELKGDGIIEISKAIGYNKGDISSFMSNRKKVTRPFLKKFADYYKFTYAELIKPVINDGVDNSGEPKSVVEKIREKKLFSRDQKGVIAVPIKAQANYTKHFDDVVYQNQLERIYFPNSPYDGDSYRFFQVEGDSMEYIDEVTGRSAGIEDGAWVIAEKIPPEDWPENLRQFYVHIVVTRNRITLKRILQDNKTEIVLHADNDVYGQERLPLSEVKEIWIFRRKLDWSAPPPRRIEIKV